MTIQVTLTQNQWQVWQAAQMTIDKANALIDRSCKFPLEALPSEILAEGKVTEASYTHQRSHMVLNWVTPQAALTNIMVLMNAALDGHSNKDDFFAIVLPVFDDVQVLTSVGPSFMASSRLRTGHHLQMYHSGLPPVGHHQTEVMDKVTGSSSIALGNSATAETESVFFLFLIMQC
jgi:hypothetical protein